VTNYLQDRSDVAGRLRGAREQAGLSQGQAAKALDMHRPTISECEAGRRKVSAEELIRFAQLYRVTAAWLAGDIDATLSPEISGAARELASLKPRDRERVMEFLRSVSKGTRAHP
jgi:transcriptional regulator with XRE-family HTH domain